MGWKIESAAQLLGGLGLFLLGMVVMTTGLKALAGPALRKILTRFTHTPVSGAATGALTTAMVQSSSATTVAAIGFVSAGLLTFSQALGIIFGANLGTTITGWLVALVGFKLKLGTLVLPLIFVGALLRLFGRPKLANAGLALAGFGLIFVGIGMLQGAMSGTAELVSPDSFPPDTWFGRFLLVLIGIAITLVTQSSSAGVAIALVAVNAGTISFNQGAALVIGMDVGTTATAALATIGASPQARRTGFAHVIYNCLTGIGAFLLLPAFTWALGALSDGSLPTSEPELSLVGFHTFFNGLGVLIVLPFTNRFAAWIERLVPDRGSPLTSGLDTVLLAQPEVALAAAAHAVQLEAEQTLTEYASMLDGDLGRERRAARISELDKALEQTRTYVAQIRAPAGNGRVATRLVSMYHAVDHLRRLLDRCEEQTKADAAATSSWLAGPRGVLHDAVVATGVWLQEPTPPCPEEPLADIWTVLHEDREPFREQVLASYAAGDLESPDSLEELDAARWLERTAYHAWRVTHHLGRILEPGAVSTEELPPHVEQTGPAD